MRENLHDARAIRRHRQRIERTEPQPPCGDHHGRFSGTLQDRTQHDDPGEQVVRPAGCRREHRPAPGGIQTEEGSFHAPEDDILQASSVDPVGVERRELELRGHQARHAARDPDHDVGTPREGDLVEHASDALPHRQEVTRTGHTDLPPQNGLGQPDRSERMAVAEVRQVEAHRQLGGASPEVHHEHATLEVEPRTRAQERAEGLLLPIDDPETEPGSCRDL